LDVNVGAQSGVVGEIPAFVIGIVVEHDVIAVPIPVVRVTEVIGCDGEVVAVEPETLRTAAAKAPSVALPETTIVAAVFPQIFPAVALIVPAVIVPNPFAVAVNVRRFGMALTIAIGSAGRIFASWGVTLLVMPLFSMPGWRTMAGHITAANVAMSFLITALIATVFLMIIVLRQSGQGKE
jgi:hypothetical protein